MGYSDEVIGVKRCFVGTFTGLTKGEPSDQSPLGDDIPLDRLEA